MSQARFGVGPLGYDQAQVDSHIGELSAKFERELANLRARLDELSSEKQRLSTEATSVLGDLAAEQRKSEVTSAAEASARRSAQHLEEIAKYKAERIIADAGAKVLVHREYLVGVSAQLELAKKELAGLLDTARSSLDRTVANRPSGALGVAPSEGPNPVGRVTSPTLAIAPPAAPAQAPARKTDAAAAEPAEQVQPAEPVSTKVVGRIFAAGEAKKAFVSKRADGLLRIDISAQNLKIVAQNGTAIGQISNLVIEGQSGTVAGYEVVRSVLPATIRDGSIIPASNILAVKPDRLIADASVLEGVPALNIHPAGVANPQASVQSQALQGQQTTGSLVLNDAQSQALAELQRAAVAWSQLQFGGAGQGTSPETAAWESVGEVAEAPYAAVSNQVEPQAEREVPARERGADRGANVKRSVEDGQMKYIVGKVAGRDLVGSDGALIAAKGQEITSEIVTEARRDGKLAALIVHMVMPGMDPDEEIGDGLAQRNIS